MITKMISPIYDMGEFEDVSRVRLPIKRNKKVRSKIERDTSLTCQIRDGLLNFENGKDELISTLLDEMKTLRNYHVRYLELEERVSLNRERSNIVHLMLNSSPDGVFLWKFIKETINHVEKIRMIDLEVVLSNFGIKATRQAIEGAIKTKKTDFFISKKGRAKFISLRK